MSDFAPSQRKQGKKTQDITSSSSVIQPVRDVATPETAPVPGAAASPHWRADITHAEQFGHSISSMAIHHEEVMQRLSSSTSKKDTQAIGESETGEQREENRTGLPDAIKTGVESLSGYSLNDIQVHYNSSKPSEVDALAYTQGTEIHVGPGQEQHLAHEAWHVVQQKQGRVTSTIQMKGVAINDDEGLEKEADVMGKRAVTGQSTKESLEHSTPTLPDVIQRVGGYVNPTAQGSRSTETTREEAPQQDETYGIESEKLNKVILDQISERLIDVLAYKEYDVPVEARLQAIKLNTDLWKSSFTEISGLPNYKELRTLIEDLDKRANAIPGEMEKNPNKWNDVKKGLWDLFTGLMKWRLNKE